MSRLPADRIVRTTVLNRGFRISSSTPQADSIPPAIREFALPYGSRQGDTRLRLLDAAESLFAERGFEGTSVRALTREAGASLSAVGYHFGSKQALIREALSRRLEPINRRRLALLGELAVAEADAGDDFAEVGSLPRIHKILDAYLRPTLERRQEEEDVVAARIGQIAARLYSDPHPAVVALEKDLLSSVYRRFIAALSDTLPELSTEAVELRFHFMLGSFAHCLGGGGLARQGGPLASRVLLEKMVAYAAAGFSHEQFPRNGANE